MARADRPLESEVPPYRREPGPAIASSRSCVDWFRQWLRARTRARAGRAGPCGCGCKDSMPPTHQLTQKVRAAWSGRARAQPAGRVAAPSPARAVLMPEGAGRRSCRQPPCRSARRLGRAYAGKWCSYAAPPDSAAPTSGRMDGGALVFDTAPLAVADRDPWVRPTVELALASTGRSRWFAGPGSATCSRTTMATRVTYGLLNLTQRDSREHPEPIASGAEAPGRVPYERLQPQALPAGHRIPAGDLDQSTGLLACACGRGRRR